jgi:hypothetical protein
MAVSVALGRKLFADEEAIETLAVRRVSRSEQILRRKLFADEEAIETLGCTELMGLQQVGSCSLMKKRLRRGGGADLQRGAAVKKQNVGSCSLMKKRLRRSGGQHHVRGRCAVDMHCQPYARFNGNVHHI